MHEKNPVADGRRIAAECQRPGVEVSAPSALLMEKETGTVLFAKNEHERLEPASVTKIMTLLLTMEAIDGGDTAL